MARGAVAWLAPLVAAGGDLAKLKSLLYGRIGRSGYTGWILTGDFPKHPRSRKLFRVLFFFSVTDKCEPSKLGHRSEIGLDGFLRFSTAAIIKFLYGKYAHCCSPCNRFFRFYNPKVCMKIAR